MIRLSIKKQAICINTVRALNHLYFQKLKKNLLANGAGLLGSVSNPFLLGLQSLNKIQCYL